MKIITNTPIFDGDKFLGFLEVDLEEIVKGDYKPLTELDLINFISPLFAVYSQKPIIGKKKG